MPVGPGSGFVLGVLGIFQPEPHFHVAHKRAALTSWIVYVFLLVVVCHGGDLLKAALLLSSVCIMETCFSPTHMDLSNRCVCSTDCGLTLCKSRLQGVNVKIDSNLWLSE